MRVKLAGMYAGTGALLSGVDTYSGLVLIKSCEARAEEMVRACRHSKLAWKWLERIVSGSDITSCVIGHGLMLYAIMAHQGKLVKNEQILAMTGYAEWQVMAPPPGMNDASSKAGNTGDTGQTVARGVQE
jgi:hypothetical protein